MKRTSIKRKLYTFIISIILVISIITTVVTYYTISYNTNKLVKQYTIDNSKNFANYVDGDFIVELKTILKSDEYQNIRQKAETLDNEQLIEDYLKKKGVWDKFYTTRHSIDTYINNIKSIRYIYIVDYNDTINAPQDMYIIDDSNSELYIMGYYEIREKEFTDKDITHLDEPVISYGDWGWLCSYYSIVYDSKGNPVCLVGCDVDMNEIMHERYKFLATFITLIIGISIIIYIGAIYIIKKLIIKPLNQINNETQKFNPTDSNSTIINLSLPNNEIGDIYKSIKTLETNINTYIYNLNQVENDNKIKDTQILKLTDKTYKDALTSVGNVNAYNQKIKDLYGTYAIVMLDINNLKQINDKFGHKVGDEYIKGCCKLICNAFKHSPVYRIGGDEFIVILQKVDYDNRQFIIDKLTKTFDDLYNNTNIDLPYRYSMSIGMAISKPDMSVEDVYNLADKQMYNNKVLFKQVYGSYR